MGQRQVQKSNLDHVCDLLVCHLHAELGDHVPAESHKLGWDHGNTLQLGHYLTSLWLIVPELSRSNILNASSISSSDTCNFDNMFDV